MFAVVPMKKIYRKAANDVFSVQNPISWNSLIAGYVRQGRNEAALKCYEQMQRDGFSPNKHTFSWLLKGCGIIGAVAKGEEIHEAIRRQGLLGKDVVLGTSLVYMYVRCSELEKAAQALMEIPDRNIFCWSALIAGYARHGHGKKALKCFGKMQHEGFSPDTVIYVSILKACGSIGAIEKGEQIHKEIVRRGMLEQDIVLANSLVDMYSRCSVLVKAARVFDTLPLRNTVTWNTLITGCVQHGQSKEALKFFELMQHEGISPDAVTLIGTLKACGCIRALDEGRQIHEEILGRQTLGKDVVLGTTLVGMYAKCGALDKAAQVFNELPNRNVVSWNALIAGYVQHGQDKEAMNCFAEMQQGNLSPDIASFICILKACGNTGAVDKGKEIHDEIVKRGLLIKQTELGNSVVDMYVKCGELSKAFRVLDELPVQNAVTWSALIAGYAKQGKGDEALTCFNQMQRQGFSPCRVTFMFILKACGSIGAGAKGEEIHEEIVKRGLLDNNIMLGTALVDMYAKCGDLARAAWMLDELHFRDIISWSILIIAYAQQGQGMGALKSFEQMQSEGLSPDSVTLASLLHACSHSGFVDEGRMHFANLGRKYDIIPDVEHWACMTDLFYRAGEFCKAIAVIKKIPCCDYLTVWCGLLGACRQRGNIRLATWAFQKFVNANTCLCPIR